MEDGNSGIRRGGEARLRFGWKGVERRGRREVEERKARGYRMVYPECPGNNERLDDEEISSLGRSMLYG